MYSHYPGVDDDRRGVDRLGRASRAPTPGGLGFGFKWNMGWMHDTLSTSRRSRSTGATTKRDDVRVWSTRTPSTSSALSHDEVVHGKASLLEQDAGRRWRQVANVRALFGYMWGTPASSSCSWASDSGPEQGRRGPNRSAWTGGCSSSACTRRAAPGTRPERPVPPHPRPVGAGHFTGRVRLDRPARRPGQRAVLPAVRQEGRRRAGRGRGRRPAQARRADQAARAGQRDRGVRRELLGAAARRLPASPAIAGRWREVLNTDAIKYGGSGVGNLGRIVATQEPWHGQPASAQITLPPLGVLWLVPKNQVLASSAVHHKRLPGHEGRGIAGEEHGRPRHFLGTAPAAHRDARQHALGARRLSSTGSGSAPWRSSQGRAR